MKSNDFGLFQIIGKYSFLKRLIIWVRYGIVTFDDNLTMTFEIPLSPDENLLSRLSMISLTLSQVIALDTLSD